MAGKSFMRVVCFKSLFLIRNCFVVLDRRKDIGPAFSCSFVSLDLFHLHFFLISKIQNNRQQGTRDGGLLIKYRASTFSFTILLKDNGKDLQWDTTLGDHNNKQFQQLANKVRSKIGILFINTTGLYDINIIGFHQGSVYANFQITLQNNTNTTQHTLVTILNTTDWLDLTSDQLPPRSYKHPSSSTYHMIPQAAQPLHPSSSTYHLKPQAAQPLHPSSTYHLKPQAAQPLHPSSTYHLKPQAAQPLHPSSTYHLKPQAAQPLHPSSTYHLIPQAAQPLHPSSTYHLKPQAAQPLHPSSTYHLIPQAAQPMHPSSTYHLKPQAAQPMHPSSTYHLKPQAAQPMHPSSTNHLKPQAAQPLHPSSTYHLKPQAA
ncbi:hypothetical protein QZH41_004852 [Actinostola sp. cb2023]|nr:hypothetical protein QZH41_004852 [Actinostola sp. cb2023]